MLSLLNINSPINAKFTIPRSWSTARGDNRQGNRKSKSKSEKKSQSRENILVVSLETSPDNKPRRVRFVVINDLGVIIETFTFREESRISSSSWDLHAFYLSSATGDVELRELLEEDFDEIRGSIYNFLFFFYWIESWIQLDVRNGDEKTRKVLDKKGDWFVVVDSLWNYCIFDK